MYSVNIPKPPYYHGTSESSANSIINNGIIKSQLQSRDRGFFGEGFYVCCKKQTAMGHATTVSNNSPAILELEFKSSSRILYAGETIERGSLSPNSKPSWHEEFIEWSVNSMKEAAVWNYATDKSESEIINNGKKERTPGSEEFDRLKWYKNVTNFAKDVGYDIIYWTRSEIIINSDTNMIDNINRCY